MIKNPNLLVILDGFGYSKKRKYNAIFQAQSMVMQLFKEYPSCLLKSSGTYVGLLDGMIGNSEVGHLTIGSGRIIKQPVSILHQEIVNGSFFKRPELIEKLKTLRDQNTTLHLMGLLSDAGVHSHIEDLFALIDLAHSVGLKKIIVHPFLDGRDVEPKSAGKYLKKLQKKLNQYKIGSIGTIHGRFYAMDRDKNYQRTQKTYEVLTQPTNCNNCPKFNNWASALNYFYKHNITDEFVPPTCLIKNANIKDGDALIFFNLREDRARQLAQAFLEPEFDKFKAKKVNLLWMVTGVQYQPNFNTTVLTIKEIVKETFFDVLENEKMKLFSIAETEKYAHITYFFNGGREIIRSGETRILVPSKSFAHTYVNIPELSSSEITDIVVKSLQKNPQDFYLINYANADLVGHSGNLEATIKAIKYIDEQIKRLLQTLEKYNGTLYITSDHGNAEEMFDTGTVQFLTAHTTNPVPFIMVNKNFYKKSTKLNLTGLADIAPFILKNLHIKIPDVMKRDHRKKRA